MDKVIIVQISGSILGVYERLDRAIDDTIKELKADVYNLDEKHLSKIQEQAKELSNHDVNNCEYYWERACNKTEYIKFSKHIVKTYPNINVIKVVNTCMACPSQWDAWTDNGRKLYIRFRHGTLRIDDMDEDETLFVKSCDGDGVMNYEELKEHTKLFKINWPKYESNL